MITGWGAVVLQTLGLLAAYLVVLLAGLVIVGEIRTRAAIRRAARRERRQRAAIERAFTEAREREHR